MNLKGKTLYDETWTRCGHVNKWIRKGFFDGKNGDKEKANI